MAKFKNMKFIIKRCDECFYVEKEQEEYIVYDIQDKKQERLKAEPFFDIYGGDKRISILSFLDKMEQNLCLFSLTDQEFYYLSSLITKIRNVIIIKHRRNFLHLLGLDRNQMMKNPNISGYYNDLFLLIRNYNNLYPKDSNYDLTLEMFDEPVVENKEEALVLKKEKDLEESKELDILMVRLRERANEQKVA